MPDSENPIWKRLTTGGKVLLLALVLAIAVPLVWLVSSTSESGTVATTTVSTPTLPKIPVGLMASPSQWAAKYGHVLPNSECAVGTTCYGPLLLNDYYNGTFGRYLVIESINGATSQFEVEFPNGTSVTTVLALVKTMLPADAKIGPVVLGQFGYHSWTCGLSNGSSADLGKFYKVIGSPSADQASHFWLKLEGAPSRTSVANFYMATNVQTVYVGFGSGVTAC